MKEICAFSLQEIASHDRSQSIIQGSKYTSGSPDILQPAPCSPGRSKQLLGVTENVHMYYISSSQLQTPMPGSSVRWSRSLMSDWFFHLLGTVIFVWSCWLALTMYRNFDGKKDAFCSFADLGGIGAMKVQQKMKLDSMSCCLILQVWSHCTGRLFVGQGFCLAVVFVTAKSNKFGGRCTVATDWRSPFQFIREILWRCP